MPDVVYEMSLKDRFTGPMKEANVAAETLHGTMTTLLTTLGVGFGVYQLVDYFKEAREEVEKIHQAEGQLQAGLVSTQHAAGIGYEELTAQAEKFSHTFRYTKAQVMDMQSLMITFPNITKDNFEGASQAILDMSARLHKGADQVAIMVGKALQDPARGILALRRVGVNFDKEHTDRIKRMIQQGHILQAQAAIMKELQTEFAGSAAANAAADPLFAFNKSLEETKEQIGDVVVEIQKQLAPTLLYLAERFRDLVDWLKKNGDELWSIVKALGAAFIAFRAGSLIAASYTALMEGMAVAEGAAATATEGLATATTAALGPLGLIAAAVASLVYLYNQLSDSAGKANGIIEANADAGKKSEISLLDIKKEYNKKRGFSDYDATQDARQEEITKLTKWVSEFQGDFDKAKSAMDKGEGNLVERTANLVKAKGDLAHAQAQLQVATDYGIKGPMDISKTGVKPSGEGVVKPETKGAKGNKVVTINIKIDSLIKDFQIRTTNLKESTQKVQEAVTQVMMNAVNNSQIIAGN